VFRIRQKYAPDLQVDGRQCRQQEDIIKQIKMSQNTSEAEITGVSSSILTSSEKVPLQYNWSTLLPEYAEAHSKKTNESCVL